MEMERIMGSQALQVAWKVSEADPFVLGAWETQIAYLPVV